MSAQRTLRNSSIWLAVISLGATLSVSCSEPLTNRVPLGERFPEVTGEALDKKTWRIPQEWAGEPTLALLGYVQDSQFDIDRWLIGLDMTQTQVKVYEVPTVKGLIPRMIKGTINEGMRSGIPAPIWSAVITVYADGERVQRFTGNERPRNARVILLDAQGVVRYFTDEGFSVAGLNRLREVLSALKSAKRQAAPSAPVSAPDPAPQVQTAP